MNEPAQDIDSGTGQVVTPGEPVDHTDMLDGASAGHSIEPEGDPPPPAPDVHEPGQQVSTKPGELSRDDIYSKARETRDIQDAVDAEDQSPEQKAAIQRAIAEATGVPADDQSTDPYDGDGNLKEGWVDTGAAPAQVVTHQQPIDDPSATPQPIAQNLPPAIDPGNETVTIVVYGEKHIVPRAEVDLAGGVANYQKGVAADERMKRASTYEASLRSYDQELQQRAANLQTPQATDPQTADPDLPPTGDQGSVNVQAYSEKLVGAMYSGDREAAITEAAEVLGSFRDELTRSVQQNAAQPEPGQSPAEVQAANNRALAAERERLDANAVFVEEFSDLQSDTLRDVTYRTVQAVAAEPIMYGRPLAEITREAGMRVRADIFGENAPAPTPPTAPQPAPANQQIIPQPVPAAPGADLATRMALKSRTVVQPLIPAAGRFNDAPAAEQTTESNSDYISRMKRESRGQHV